MVLAEGLVVAGQLYWRMTDRDGGEGGMGEALKKGDDMGASCGSAA